jgi:hypothetical protein
LNSSLPAQNKSVPIEFVAVLQDSLLMAGTHNQGFENLVSRIERLSKLNPLAVSITWGAGGSTKDWSLKLASICRNDHNVDTIMHLTCTNMQIGMVDDALRVGFGNSFSQLDRSADADLPGC